MTQFFLGLHLLFRLVDGDLAHSASSRTRGLESLVGLIMVPFRPITDALGIRPVDPTQPGLDTPALVVFVALTVVELAVLLLVHWLDRRPAGDHGASRAR
jgi:hypothetical protein